MTVSVRRDYQAPSMNARLLTESGWKAVLSKHRIRDNGLQRALAAYEDVEKDEHDNRLEAIAVVSRLSGQLKRVRDVASNSEVVDYLDELEGAAETEEREVTREKAAAAKVEAANQRSAEAEEDEESVGDYKECLLLAFKKLKSMRGQAMQFIVCDARPFCGIMIAKRITPKHKQQLTEVTGGSKKFLRIGTCCSDGDRYIFTPEQALQGLARKIQVSVRNFTGKKLPIVVGDESAEDGDEEPE